MHTTEAIVLGRIPIGEADFLISFYTEQFGKLRMRAMGVRKETAKLKGHIELLNRVRVQFVMGRNGARLTHATMTTHWPHLRSDVDRARAGLALARAVDEHCFEHMKDDGIWALLTSTLAELETAGTLDTGALMRRFRSNFGIALGIGPDV